VDERLLGELYRRESGAVLARTIRILGGRSGSSARRRRSRSRAFRTSCPGATSYQSVWTPSRALELVRSEPERRYLSRRLAEVQGRQDP
jgi:hypothetical protein